MTETVLGFIEKSEERLREIARGNIERHLDVDCNSYYDQEALADVIYTEAYTLGVDALLDHGVDSDKAVSIAMDVAQGFAQP